MFLVLGLLLVMQSFWTYGWRWTAAVFLLGMVLGFVCEYAGTTSGFLFGHFLYVGWQPFLLTGAVPLGTPVSWAIVIYIAYNITNLSYFGFGGFRIPGGGRMLRSLLVLSLSALDGLICMNLDMLLDPIMVSPEKRVWVWSAGGPYFDVPISNFAGWFGLGFCATLLVRTLEIHTGGFRSIGNRLVHYFPVLAYMVSCLTLCVSAMRLGYPQVALIGFSCMIPFVGVVVALHPRLLLFSPLISVSGNRRSGKGLHRE